jgi:hypothetical protein
MHSISRVRKLQPFAHSQSPADRHSSRGYLAHVQDVWTCLRRFSPLHVVRPNIRLNLFLFLGTALAMALPFRGLETKRVFIFLLLVLVLVSLPVHSSLAVIRRKCLKLTECLPRSERHFWKTSSAECNHRYFSRSSFAYNLRSKHERGTLCSPSLSLSLTLQ